MHEKSVMKMTLTAKNIWFTLLLFPFIEDILAVSIDYLEAVKVEDEPEVAKHTNSSKKTDDEIYHETSSTDSNKLKLLFLRRKIFSTPGYGTPSTPHKTTVRPTPTVSTNPFILLQGYDYNYEVPNQDKDISQDTEFMERTSVLGMRTEEKFTEDKQELNSTNSNDDNNIHNELYNLEPAAALMKIKKTSFEDPRTSIWYVPEKYPCWELPILYGELEERFSHRDVFQIHPIKLKNVVFDSMEENFSHEDFLLDDSRFSKWCAMPPCYGDHTLCLFPLNINAKICGEDYTVKVPTKLERTALVNTLNSMRNHVAKGSPKEYPYLPAAANMKQVLYDSDLEIMAKRWLKQCLPGPAPCISLDWNIVSQLECTKSADECCKNKDPTIKCTPLEECFVHPVIGCLHSWFWSAGGLLNIKDVKCGYMGIWTYNLAQLLWANTNKVGCAYGERPDGDIRVICNFCPGAPFSIDTKFYCGLLPHKDNRNVLDPGNVTDIEYLHTMLNMNLEHAKKWQNSGAAHHKDGSLKKIMEEENGDKKWGVVSLRRIYKERWVRKKISRFLNGTMGFTARLVTRYQFEEETKARCDTNEPVYEPGEPGALCPETGKTYHALCYEFCDIPGYRVISLIAALGLFSLILYDLFSSVMRQLHS